MVCGIGSEVAPESSNKTQLPPKMNNENVTTTEGELMQAIRATYGDDYANEILANIEHTEASIARANASK